jgi:Regulatory CLIP domain of proteinases
MCCSDGVPQPTPTPPPPPPQTTRAPAQPAAGNPCRTPDDINGYCIGVKQCPSVLQIFVQRQKDPEYIKYIRQSNANCNYASQAICCPNDAPVTQPPLPTSPDETPIAQPNRVGSRLFLPSEGCGVSKVPHNRVVGGVPAKKGE